jgi:RNA polymerase sigma factor (sigma-70 family)
MPNPTLSATVARAGRAATRTADPAETDGRLLARFARTRDEPAFRELVGRLGPMVLGVCRRVGGDDHLADDAFQATFLVLARRAADVCPPEAVRGWLYGVAVRVAREARTVSARRRAREAPVASVPDRPARSADPPDPDALRALDEEVAALPEHLRAAVVLCELDGDGRSAAAQRLGIAEGTLSSRLAKARKILADRLRRRGVALPAAGLSVVLGRSASAAVPPVLAERAVAVAVSPGPAPAAVAALSHGVFRSMFLTKLKAVAPFLGLAAVALFACGLLASPGTPRADSPNPPAAKAQTPKPAAQPAPKPAGPGRILVWDETKFVFYAPDGKEGDSLPGHPDKRIITRPALSPDGKWVAFVANDDPPADDKGFPQHHVFVRPTDGTGDGTKVTVNAAAVFWSADGKLIAAELLRFDDPKDAGFATWSIDPKTGEKAAVDLPKLFHAFSATPDGKAFVGGSYDLAAQSLHLALVTADGKTVTKLTRIGTEGPNPRVSPDGGKILYQDFAEDDKVEKDGHRLLRLWVFDLKAKKAERLAEVPANAFVQGYCWSPDGKKVAYTWKQAKPGVPLAANTDNMNDPKLNTETESFLVVADADGKNPKTLLTRKAPFAPTTTLGTLDWR